MTQKMGILYASVDGQTKKICKRINLLLRDHEIDTELYPIDAFNGDLSTYHTLIIGASIRYGRHNKKIYEFIRNHKDGLEKIQTAFFSVNLVARKKEKNAPSSNPYMIKFLEEINWKADFLEVFAGKLDYKSYSFFDRIMIKLIMKFTNGPTKSEAPIEFTDWDKVNDFGLRIAKTFGSTEQNSSYSLL